MAALVLSTSLAIAQESSAGNAVARVDQPESASAQGESPDDRKKCKYVTAERGGSSRIVPADKLKASDARQFPYLLDDTRLRDEFKVGDERRKECGLFLFGIDTASAASGAAGGGAAAAGAAAPGGVAAGGAGIGVGTISAGAIAGIGIAALVAGTVAGVATAGGGSGPSNPPTTCTTCDGSTQ